MPNRRSSAEAFQLLLAHALGEAGAPYIVALIAEAFEANMSYDTIEENRYWSMQYALFVTLAFLVVGGIIFLTAAFTVVKDKQKVDLFYESKQARVKICQ